MGDTHTDGSAEFVLKVLEQTNKKYDNPQTVSIL